MSAPPVAVPKPERRSEGRDRRAHVRHHTAELQWLRTLRLKHGPSVSLVDLSAGGALLETAVALKPGSTMVLELAPAGQEPTLVTMRVLRSQIISLRSNALVYRGAGVFTELLQLPALLYSPPPVDRPQPPRPFLGIDASLKLLVDKYRESRTAGGLQTTDVLQVLRTLRSRAERLAGDRVAAALVDLFPEVSGALERRDNPVAVLATIESRLRTAIPHAQICLADVALQPREGDGTLVLRPEYVTDLAFALNVRVDPGARLEPADHQLLNAAMHLCSLLDAAGLRRVDEDASAASRWQKIVVRYKDGRLLKGFTHDFHPTRAHFAIWPSVNAPQHEGVQVPIAGLKAVFFVRDFRGDADYVEEKRFEQGGHGRRIEVTFFDQEVLVGRTLSYRPEGQGFFLLPADPRTNNVRVFVVTSAVRHVRFLGQSMDAAPPVLQLAG